VVVLVDEHQHVNLSIHPDDDDLRLWEASILWFNNPYIG
jgi:hypothetical protein